MITVPTTLRGLARRLLAPEIERELANAKHDLAKAYKQINHDREFFLGLDELADRCGFPEVGLLYDRIEAAGEELATTKEARGVARGVILQLWVLLSRDGVPRVDAWEDAYEDVVKVAKATRAESDAARAVLDRVFAGTSEQSLADRIEVLIARQKECVDDQSDAFARLRDAYGKEAQTTAQVELALDDALVPRRDGERHKAIRGRVEELAARARAAHFELGMRTRQRDSLAEEVQNLKRERDDAIKRSAWWMAATNAAEQRRLNYREAARRLRFAYGKLAEDRDLTIGALTDRLGRVIEDGYELADEVVTWKAKHQSAETRLDLVRKERDRTNAGAMAYARKAEGELRDLRHSLHVEKDWVASLEREHANTYAERNTERERAAKAEAKVGGLEHMLMMMTADRDTTAANLSAALETIRSEIPHERVSEIIAERDEATARAEKAEKRDAEWEAPSRVSGLASVVHAMRAKWGVDPECAHEHVDDLGNGWGRCRDCGDESFPMTAETAGQLRCCGSYGEHEVDCESEDAQRDREACDNDRLARSSLVCLAPRPWRVERDWTFEVTAADGTIVHKASTPEEAEAICDVANVDYERAEANARLVLKLEAELDKHGDACPGLDWHDEITSLIQDALDEACLPHDDDAGPRYELIAESVRQAVGRMLSAEKRVVELEAALAKERVETADRHRGHAMHETPDGWVYTDTGKLVSEVPDRDCGHCGRANTPQGHDGCLGTLPGVRNACCGHGHDEPYLQFLDGSDVRGAQIMRDHARLLDAARVLANCYAIDILRSGALVGLSVDVDALDEAASTAWRTVLRLARLAEAKL